MSEELKPCPLCLGAAESKPDEEMPRFLVECVACGLVKFAETESEARAAWNSRPESAIEQAARKVTEVRAKLHRGECVGEELTEALDALCEAVESQPEILRNFIDAIAGYADISWPDAGIIIDQMRELGWSHTFSWLGCGDYWALFYRYNRSGGRATHGSAVDEDQKRAICLAAKAALESA
jgi:hypothetical protein